MKVNLNTETRNRVDFRGHDVVKNNKNHDIHQFWYAFDEDNFDCELEVFSVKRTKNGDYEVNHNPLKNLKTGENFVKLEPGLNNVDLAKTYMLAADDDFAYHFKLREKNTKDKKEFYRVDAGNVIDNKGENPSRYYNVHVSGGSRLHKGGSMLLTMADLHNPLWVYDNDNKIVRNKDADKVFKSVKNFSNKVGGTLAGVEKGFETGEYDSYSRLIMTPFQTGDKVSGHGYWIANAMQMALSQGNMNNYASLTRKLFHNGMNFVSDAALVNEGLEGVHFSKVIKYGQDSEFFNWFKVQGLKDSPLAFPAFSEKKNFVASRVVNSPYQYTQNENGKISIEANKKYQRNKPTYVQVYDKRLVDESKLDSSRLIEEYDRTNTKNQLEINNFNDTIIPYKIEVNPDTFNDNVKRLNEYNSLVPKAQRLKMTDYKGIRFLTKFENVDAENRFESGFDTWDANPDIAKLDYEYSHADTEEWKNLNEVEREQMKAQKAVSRAQVRDYAITAGVYWTEQTKNILKKDIAQNLKDLNTKDADAVEKRIDKLIKAGKLPKNLKMNFDKDVITAIVNGQYKTDKKVDTNPYTVQIIGNMMNLPLDAIELGDDISGTFATSYMTKRASHKDYVGKSRYELWQAGNPHLTANNKALYTRMDSIYQNEMFRFAVDVLSQVEEKLGQEGQLHDKYGNTTKFGKEVLPIFAQEIAKFAIIKGLKPDADFEFNSATGEISYDYKQLKNTTLRDVGVFANSEKDEARQLMQRLESGIPAIPRTERAKLASAIARSIIHTNETTYQLADAIIDKSNAGLDWRIDAAKDIVDLESLRNKQTAFKTAWEDIIGFWKNFADNVYKVNPNSYLVAEVTDEKDIHNKGGGYYSDRFKTQDIVSKFLRETGITSTADYSYFFSTTAKLFTTSGEDASGMGYDKIKSMVFNQLVGEGNFLRSGDMNSVIYAYNFVDNHDKPRILDTLATDNVLFYANLQDWNNWQARQSAYRIMHNKIMDPIIPRLHGESDGDYQDRVNEYITKTQDFSLISPKACARGWTLNSGFGKAIAQLYPASKNSDKNKMILEAINESIADLVKGSYKGHNFEAEGFGVKPYDTCVDIVLEQAKAMHGLNLSDEEVKKLGDLAFEKILDPQFSKLLGMMKVLVGVPGIPTLFAGDDKGSTGYEQKTKNIYQSNRNVIHREWVQKGGDRYKKFIDKHSKEIDEVMGLRAQPKLHAMNDGAPYCLIEQNAYRVDDENKAKGTSVVDALLRVSKDNSMVITLFNLRGAKQEDDNGYSNGNYLHYDEYYRPIPVKLEKLYFNEGGEDVHGIKGGLKQGLKFVNANNPHDIYYTRVDKDHGYYLEHLVNGHPSPIIIDDTILNLYHVPNNDDFHSSNEKDNDNANLSFTGRKKVLYNPQYQFISKVSNPYEIKKQAVVGSSLALTSR